MTVAGKLVQTGRDIAAGLLFGVCQMPIKIPDQLPAHEILVREGVSVMDERTAW